ncbi:unnamed protein product [Boreogadus saida]
MPSNVFRGWGYVQPRLRGSAPHTDTGWPLFAQEGPGPGSALHPWQSSSSTPITLSPAGVVVVVVEEAVVCGRGLGPQLGVLRAASRRGPEAATTDPGSQQCVVVSSTSFNRDSVKAGTGRRFLGGLLDDSSYCYTLEVSFYSYMTAGSTAAVPYTEETSPVPSSAQSWHCAFTRLPLKQSV